MKLEIIDIKSLKPLEKVFPSHLQNIKLMIDSDEVIKKPIIIDKNTGTVLEGSHRYAYLMVEGYKYAPVYKVDYMSEDVRVGTKLSHRFLVHDSTGISKQECIERSLKGHLYYPRTTRHFFTFRKNDISVSLDTLIKGKPRDIAHLLENSSVVEELQHNKKYINEINNEITIISSYIAEIIESKEYLKKQVVMLENQLDVGFFPGKFHPPHMGHVRTILNLAPKYRKLIVAVSADTPDNAIVGQEDVVALLKEVLGGIENIEVTSLKETLTKKEDTSGLPEFNILLSGNPDVISWAQKMGITSTFIERSFITECSGENLRRLALLNN